MQDPKSTLLHQGLILVIILTVGEVIRLQDPAAVLRESCPRLPPGAQGEAQESVSPQGDASVERVSLRAEQDAEYQRAVEADEARQRLEGPVDEAAV